VVIVAGVASAISANAAAETFSRTRIKIFPFWLRRQASGPAGFDSDLGTPSSAMVGQLCA